MRNAIAVMLLLGMFGAHKRFWKLNGAEYQYVIAGELGGEHDRVCGVVTPSPTVAGGWWFGTFRSAGARVGLMGDVSTQHQAEMVVESDCK